MKRKHYTSRKSQDGFIQVCTALHERHIEALDTMVNSIDGKKRGLTKRDVLYQIISRYLKEDGEESIRMEIEFLREEVRREFRAIQKREDAMMETLAHFIRIYLGHIPPVTSENRDVIRARSKERFSRFTEEVTGVLRRK